jgi:hypothetical protein
VALLVVSVAALLLSKYNSLKKIRNHIYYREKVNENPGTNFTILVHRFLCFYPYFNVSLTTTGANGTGKTSDLYYKLSQKMVPYKLRL